MKNKAALNNVKNITSVPLDIQDSTLFKWQKTETRVVQLHGREEGFGEDMGLVWSVPPPSDIYVVSVSVTFILLYLY